MGIFCKIKNSVYNSSEIIKFSKEGLGRAVLYALLLCTFLGIGKGIIYSLKVNSYINVVIEKLQEDKYDFSIKEGELNIKTSPVKEESSGILVYVDENIKLDDYQTLNSVFMNKDQYILFLKDGALVNSTNITNSLPPTKISYNELGIGDINNKIAIDGIKNSKIIIFPILCITIIISNLVNYLLDAFIIAVLCLLNVYILKLKIRLARVFSIVIYAATLPSILVVFLTMISPTTNFSTASVLGTLLFTFLILNNIRKDIKLIE